MSPPISGARARAAHHRAPVARTSGNDFFRFFLHVEDARYGFVIDRSVCSDIQASMYEAVEAVASVRAGGWSSRTDFRAPNTILGLELCAGVVCVCVCFPRRVPSVIINLLLSPLASQQPVVIVRALVREIDASISLVCRYRCEWFHRKSRNTRA